MPIDRTATDGLPALRPESQSWVDASIPHRRPLLDWRELVVKGMHCNRSSYTVAFPILQKYRLPATIYVTIESVETGQVAERHKCCALLEKKIGLPQNALSSRVLTWEEVHTMHQAGIAFGSHTLTHPVVSQLTLQELEQELGASKCLLEKKLGISAPDFAFPFGKASGCSRPALEMLSRFGYRSAATTVPGANTPRVNPFELRRLQVGPDGSLARFAFDLGRAFLRADEVPALNVSLAGSAGAQQARGPAGIGGALGDSDA